MNNYIKPDWPAPPNIVAYTTTRNGGVSKPPYASFNLGSMAGDDQEAVALNRKKLSVDLHLPQEPFWLKQEHTSTVRAAANHTDRRFPAVADASFTRTPEIVCAVLTADCVPILVCDQNGSVVAAIHAGWKGIAAGIIAVTVSAMNVLPDKLLAWLGPAIGPSAFKVNQEVYETFCNKNPTCQDAFIKCLDQFPNNVYFANIYGLASIFLQQSGINKIYGSKHCTFTQKDLFFSYRRDGEKSGRMASLIYLKAMH